MTAIQADVILEKNNWLYYEKTHIHFPYEVLFFKSIIRYLFNGTFCRVYIYIFILYVYTLSLIYPHKLTYKFAINIVTVILSTIQKENFIFYYYLYPLNVMKCFLMINLNITSYI